MDILLENDLVVQCDGCGEVQIIDKDFLDVDTHYEERSMGTGAVHDFVCEVQCSICGNYLYCSVSAYEYPVGALDFTICECRGGQFIQSPEAAVNYYEFDYDDFDEDRIRFDMVRLNIDRILYNRDAVYNLTPREFEELVARVFEEQGYIVSLTPRTRDGGIDIIATRDLGGLTFMVLVECKRYGQQNKVDVSLVRSLLGVQTDRKASKAVLVTSSSFTRDAREFAERHNKLIELIDFDGLLQMMQCSA